MTISQWNFIPQSVIFAGLRPFHHFKSRPFGVAFHDGLLYNKNFHSSVLIRYVCNYAWFYWDGEFSCFAGVAFPPIYCQFLPYICLQSLVIHVPIVHSPDQCIYTYFCPFQYNWWWNSSALSTRQQTIRLPPSADALKGRGFHIPLQINGQINSQSLQIFWFLRALQLDINQIRCKCYFTEADWWACIFSERFIRQNAPNPKEITQIESEKKKDNLKLNTCVLSNC